MGLNANGLGLSGTLRLLSNVHPELRGLRRNDQGDGGSLVRAYIQQLREEDESDRRDAADVLATLEPASVAAHADDLARCLESSVPGVRVAVLAAYTRLPAGSLPLHASAVAGRLEHKDWRVRQDVLRVLGNLDPATLEGYSPKVVARFKDASWHVRRAALAALSDLRASALKEHEHAIEELLDDDEWRVAETAMDLLECLDGVDDS